jgi:hypothetical protein
MKYRFSLARPLPDNSGASWRFEADSHAAARKFALKIVGRRRLPKNAKIEEIGL